MDTEKIEKALSKMHFSKKGQSLNSEDQCLFC